MSARKPSLKIVKPLTLGIMQRPYLLGGKSYLSVTSLAFFPLGTNTPLLLPEHEQWEKLAETLGQGTLIDEAMPKTKGEVLLAGHAYAPEGEPTRQLKVRLQMGEVDKTLTVLGDHHWSLGVLPSLRTSRPQPFVSMPLNYQRAYGGERFKKNPQGCGDINTWRQLFSGANQGPLPNVCYPGENPAPGRRPRQPAGFGPIAPDWAQRRPLAGRYNQKWLKTEAPGYPSTLDPRFFNMAPADQQLTGFIKGGETYTLENLHPENSQLSGCLPKLTQRAYVQLDDGALNELPMNQDTAWFYPDLDLGVVIAHGSQPINDSDGLDVRGIMLAWEHPGRHRGDDHYRNVYRLRTDPATAPAQVFNESQLTGLPASPLHLEGTEPEAPSPRLQALADELGIDAVEIQQSQAENRVLPPLNPAALASGNFDMSAMLATVDEKMKSLEAEGRQKQEALKAELADKIPERAPALPVDAALQRITIPLMEARQLTDLAAQVEDPELKQRLLETLPKLVEQQRAARRIARESQCAPVSEEAATALADWLRNALRNQQDLTGLCLAGIQISDMDFRGANFKDMVLDQAGFSRCRFDGCDLSGTCFIGARFEQCTFNGANLSHTNWALARLNKVEARASKLQQSHWHDAHARDCDFSDSHWDDALLTEFHAQYNRFNGTVLDRSHWIKCHLTRTEWRGCHAKSAAWLDSSLHSADFTEAHWVETAWLNVKARHVKFDRAELHKVFVGGESVLSGASFIECQAGQTGWRNSDFTGAIFNDAHFKESDFGMTTLAECQFQNTFLQSCILMKADAKKADFTGSNWYQSLARKMNLTEATLVDVQLHQVDLTEVLLTDAHIRRCQPAISQPENQEEAAA